MEDLPLAGTVVVALEQAVAAPFATRQLGDLGARVIKIERPGVGDFARGYDDAVDGTSTFFFWLNRGKESLTLDVKSPRGREVLARLLERADVFVHNLAPGAVDRLGFDRETLTSTYPRLVSCGLSGYGHGGPYDNKRAYDLLVQGEVGTSSTTGTPEQGVRIGLSIADISGGMYAFASVLSGLLGRTRTGRGANLETTLLDALSEWISPALYQALHGGVLPPRSADSHPSLYPYGRFRCRGGRELNIGIQNDREWVRLCTDVLGRPDLAHDPRVARNIERSKNRDFVDEVMEAALSQLSVEEVTERLDKANIAFGMVNDMADLAQHPQLAARDRWRDVETPAGKKRALRPPVDLPAGEAPMGPIPTVGEHTDSILAWLGYEPQDIATMRDTGVC
ncbi:CaiB/BaiF CoA transferase family protein [Blastococcus saxobsidens]|uniref:CoA-transferase family n=1 Tax=Blastococcus saxobsidens (strain DD2) TaxID=1146883 RepID=H6RT06_BLASD|nr:CaiB/BaiF CoA-transferase family protein [Blastococcus saxobsidens]CCG04309.1 CoA-transferase family [Blastococcus saxobsidens DD2]